MRSKAQHWFPGQVFGLGLTGKKLYKKLMQSLPSPPCASSSLLSPFFAFFPLPPPPPLLPFSRVERVKLFS